MAVVGGGPAGLMAAGTAASSGAKVLLFEKNSRCGRKLLLTGSGKCNITNQASLEQFLDRYAENGKFLYPAFKELFSDGLEHFFSRYGVRFQTEENRKVFPESKDAGSVLSALLSYCQENKVEFHLEEPVLSMEQTETQNTHDSSGRMWRITTSVKTYEAASVILATGGLSYPKTGSTGDGYALAKTVSHTIRPTRPALVPVTTEEPWSKALSGISMRNVKVSLYGNHAGNNTVKIAEQTGDLLFTHFGLSGPPILFLSRWLPEHMETQSGNHSYSMVVDLFPTRSRNEIESLLLHYISANPTRQLKTALSKEFDMPLALSSALIGHLGFSETITGQETTKAKRAVLLDALNALSFPLSGTRGYREAMVTAGGVDTKEIRPQSMESKKVSHLFFAGELIDIDGYTGGYNLQAAFSTGYLAGKNAALVID